MQDDSCIAFFDLADGQEYTPDPNTPLWVNHFAFEVNSYEDVLSMQARLKSNGIKVIGPTDHGFIRSIYFFDPKIPTIRMRQTHWGPAWPRTYPD